MLSKTFKSRLVIIFCASAVLSTGCRSGMRMPGMNMFGLRGKPSSEALAGSGPSATYPAPPSDSLTPEAIASIAGGTISAGEPVTSPDEPITPSYATAQVSGTGGPGYATQASGTSKPNMAACPSKRRLRIRQLRQAGLHHTVYNTSNHWRDGGHHVQLIGSARLQIWHQLVHTKDRTTNHRVADNRGHSWLRFASELLRSTGYPEHNAGRVAKRIQLHRTARISDYRFTRRSHFGGRHGRA